MVEYKFLYIKFNRNISVMDYKVSVIIPVYNADKYLRTAIDSVINQTLGFENIELIIVNDNSSDNSRSIIEEYSSKYDNIIDIHLEKNSGFPGKPRNVGIEIASAPYLIFLDADDEYLPEAFQIYFDTIEKEKSDFVLAAHYWNLNGDKKKIEILHECDNPSELVSLNPLLNEKNFRRATYYHVSPWGKIFNKKLILDKNIRFLEDALSEDAYFYYQTVLNSKRITYLPNDILYVYNVYDANESTIHTHNLKTFNDFFRGFEEVLALFKGIPYTKENVLRMSFNSILLLFSNLTIKEKINNIHRIHDLEMSLDEEVILPLNEIKMLNDEILKENYTRAIIISQVYSFFYKNKLIRKLYRKFR